MRPFFWLRIAGVYALASCSSVSSDEEARALSDAGPSTAVTSAQSEHDAEPPELDAAFLPSRTKRTPGDGSCAPGHCTGPGDWGPGDYPPGLHKQTYLTIEGTDERGDKTVRGYKVHVPKRYDANTPTPLLFVLHGFTENAVTFAVAAGWPDESDAEGFILVMPNGSVRERDGRFRLGGSWNAGECCGRAANTEQDDVAFIRAVAAEVGKHLNIDSSRVYATGFSNGAFLSYRLACEASDLFVAIATSAGAIGTPSLVPTGSGNADFTSCAPTHPVSVLAIHGTADPVVSYDYFLPSLEYFARQDGCTTRRVPARVPSGGGDTSCFTYAGCPTGLEVTGCTVEGGGHCWFGSDSCGTGYPAQLDRIVIGPNSDTLANTTAVWAFVSQFSRP